MAIRDFLLRISSSERSAGSSSSNFTVSYPNVQVLAKTVSIVVKHASFPNVFYNINSGNNEFIYRMAGGSDESIVVPEGQYTMSGLITYLNNELAGVGIITQNPNTFKLTLTASGYPFDLISCSMLPVLGLMPSTTPQSTHLAPLMPQLQGVQHVFIKSRVLGKGTNFIDANSKQEQSIVIMIPCDVPFGSVKHYETVHDELDVINYSSETSLQDIDIQLVDSDGYELDLQGEELSLVLKVYYLV